jgi:ribosomal protein S18 acetylase RimI-like enzyme
MTRTFAGLDLKRIEEIGLNGLQTQRQLFYDGWLLRVSPGKAKRARSVNAHFGSTLPLATKIAYCERIYAERGLPLLFRMTPFSEPPQLADELDARGYEAYETTLVQLLRIERPPDIAPPSDIVLTAPPVAEFVEAVGVLQGTAPAQREAHLERLANTPLATRAVLAMQGARAVGCGQVALEDGIAGIFSVGTASELRGRGIASAIVSGLLGWAWGRGATHAYLQVDADNHRAISVYRHFGFVTAYTYHYRAQPGQCH